MKEKMIYFKRFMKVIVFCFITVLMIYGIYHLMVPKYREFRWDSTSTAMAYYEMPKQSIEALVIGSSVSTAAVDSMQLYTDYGIASYNLSQISEPMVGTYYWMKEVYEDHFPKVVVIEVQIATRQKEKREELYRKAYDHMNFGVNKLKWAYQHCSTTEDASYLDYFFPLYMFHNRWNELSQLDLDYCLGDINDYTKGYNALVKTYRQERKELDFSDTEKLPKGYSKVDYAYLDKVISLCQSHGSEVVLFKTTNTTWTTAKHNLIQQLADKDDVPFIDFNDPALIKKIGLNYATDANDRTHLNYLGAAKLTGYLGKYLTKNYDLEDIRNTKKAETYENALPEYTAYMKEAESLHQNY